MPSTGPSPAAVEHPLAGKHHPQLPTVMKAAVITEFGAPLALESRPLPSPGAGEVLVRVETCGVCHTDIHAAEGAWPRKPELPRVPGHEIIGRVAALGPGVEHARVGERVAVPRLWWACGRCEACLSGTEVLCPRRKLTGYDVDGGFAEYVLASADHIVEVPFGLDPPDAACLTCAGVNAYKAVKLAGCKPSDVTAVFGVGGVGHLAVQYARCAGATVTAVDLTGPKLTLAHELGASHLVNAAVDDPVAAIRGLGGADQAVVTAVSVRAAEQALASLRPGGTLVLVGLPLGGTLPVPIFDAVRRGLRVLGSAGGNRVDLAETFALHTGGHTRIVHQVRTLQQINQALDEVATGAIPARLVLEFR